jgi:hypothetical protein
VIWNFEFMADGYLSVWESTQIQKDIEVLNATTEEFITFFSKINLVCVSSENMPDDVATGNSRDAPKRFLFSCHNQQCTRTFFSMLRKQQHEVNYNSKQVADLKLAECIHSNCLKYGSCILFPVT